MATQDLNTLPHVVIIGGGFGGMFAARVLADQPVRVTLLDRRNHHLFQPLLYQVATAGLNPSDIAYPIRSIFRGSPNITTLMAEVKSIDPVAKRIQLVDGAMAYDYLIVATGATHSYFGHNDWAKDAPGLKTIEDALDIRRRVLLAFEAAEREADPERRKAWLTFVCVGAGATGVEMAGALSEVADHVLKRDFRHLSKGSARVLLVEAGPRVLSAFPEGLSATAKKDLEKMGVEVVLGKSVTAIDSEGINLGEERIAARTVLWTAGVEASPLGKTLGVPTDRAGRVRVSADLSIPGAPHTFVIGDLAAATFDGGKPVPGVAPAAMQGGTHAATTILRLARGEKSEDFNYWDKGNLATIGRSRAVADLGGGRHLSGFIAWVAWLVIHIFYLIGFRNRALVLTEWFWNYLTFERGARLITGSTIPDLRVKADALPGPKVPASAVPEPVKAAPAP
jgi:NADH dehydrogenase